MPTFHVIEVCVQFQTLGQRHRYPGAQFAARTEQAVIEFHIVGFHLVAARKLLCNGDALTKKPPRPGAPLVARGLMLEALAGVKG